MDQVYFMWHCQLRVGLCVSFMESRGTVAHTEFMGSGGTAPGRCKRTDTHTWVGGGAARAVRGGGGRRGGEGRERGEVVPVATVYLTGELMWVGLNLPCQ